MSFRGLFSAKKEKDKTKSKSKLPLSAQESYDLGEKYLQKYNIVTSIESVEASKRATVAFFRDLQADDNAGAYRLAIRNKFDAVARSAENIDFLYNYFDINSNLTKELWNAFYHQYIENDAANKNIEFTGINIDDSESKLFQQLHAKINRGELDLDKITLDLKGVTTLPTHTFNNKKECTGRFFLDYMATVMAGYISDKDELVSAAIKEQQQKVLSAGARVAQSKKETKEEKRGPFLGNKM